MRSRAVNRRSGSGPPPLALGCWLVVAWGLLLLALAGPATAAGDPFPSYSCIYDNVAFWKKVYTQYPSTKGLIHDSRNLAVIYEVVSLEDEATAAGERANEALIKGRKETYRQALLALAQGRPAESAEERKAAQLFGPGATGVTLQAAAEAVRFQRCLSDRFQAGLVRSGRYLEEIKAIFGRYGLPTDLAYLPHVESSFDYQAYSKSGAAGIWQLIPATGRRFLTINQAVDERRDPILATHAAAKFLQGNFQKLDSWPLALTAYNHGLTSMLRAKNSLGTFDQICQAYDGPHFGFASRNFYAEFLAAREVAKNYRQYFPNLRLDEPLATTTFPLTANARLTDLARHFGVEAATLVELNPALQDPVRSGRQSVPKGYQLRLPKGAGAGGALAALPPDPGHDRAPRPSASPGQSHKVRPGETVSSIARHYGVSPKAILASNKLGASATLAVGQELRIPAAGGTPAKAKASRRRGK